VPLFEKKSETRDSSKTDKEGRGSGAEALLAPKSGISLQELFEPKPEDGSYGVWIALDSLTDPHNVGAIFRLAGFFGIRGILMTSERSAPLTSTVYDVSCGGVEAVPFTEQINLKQALDFAKKSDLWILGTSEHADQSYLDVPRDRHWLVVFGNEEKGMRRLTQESCDVLCQIPSEGEVKSLNVSVAAGVLISRLRQP
jgi:23S rRNA (guanosine2251-2'-O)-methyltransferase